MQFKNKKYLKRIYIYSKIIFDNKSHVLQLTYQLPLKKKRDFSSLDTHEKFKGKDS